MYAPVVIWQKLAHIHLKIRGGLENMQFHHSFLWRIWRSMKCFTAFVRNVRTIGKESLTLDGSWFCIRLRNHLSDCKREQDNVRPVVFRGSEYSWRMYLKKSSNLSQSIIKLSPFHCIKAVHEYVLFLCLSHYLWLHNVISYSLFKFESDLFGMKNCPTFDWSLCILFLHVSD